MEITVTIKLPADEMSNMQYLHIANYLDRAIHGIKNHGVNLSEKVFSEKKAGVEITCEVK